MVDKNLFAHDIAVAAILKNEGNYIKEWLDYHLLAGVGHFYLYDNDSTDAYEKIIAPYVDAGFVTSVKISGKSAQFAAYDDAVQKHRFACRFMAFIDLDEFIFPKNGVTISEALDEILTANPAAGVAINWQLFGSNGQLDADFSRGVLERFTRRAPTNWVVPIPNRDIPGGNAQIKTVANPRKINFFTSAHFPIYFAGYHSVNERGGRVENYCNEPVTAEKITLNHYNVKSREEFNGKLTKGRAGKASKYLDSSWFDMYDRNEIFDDGIIRYRNSRAENFFVESDADKFQRIFSALTKNLSAYASGAGADLETALTCRAAVENLRGKFPDDERLKIFSEAAQAAVIKSLDGLNFSDAQLFLSELPNLLAVKSPVTDELRAAAIQVIGQMMNFMRENEFWKDFADLDFLRRLIKILGK